MLQERLANADPGWPPAHMATHMPWHSLLR
jgi:hypothetical protein